MSVPPSNKTPMHRRGFTIIESMIATVVLATAVLGISTALAVSHKQNHFVREQGVLLQLAQSLAEEIAATPYTNSTGTFGGGWAANNKDRRTYDDVFDFAGYADQSPFTSAVSTGKDLDYGQNYRRSVTVEPMASPTATAASAAVSKMARVTIVATGPSGNTLTIRKWATKVDRDY